jgi:hypothetical protein
MKHTRNTIRATLVVVVVAALAVVIAPQAFAAAPSATATLTSSTGGVSTAGRDGSFTFSVTPSSRTLASFSVTAPDGWVIHLHSAGSLSSNARTITVTGLSVTSSGSASVDFTATACVADTYGFSYTATDTQGRAYNTPSSIGASVDGLSCSLALLNQPTDAKQSQHITADPFDTNVADIQVQLLDGNGAALGNASYPATVTFDLATGVDEQGEQLVSGTLTVDPEPTDANGVATFVGLLQIAEKNEPNFTSYGLQPKTTSPAGITGAASDGFDVWETQCNTLGGCPVSLRGSNDLYTSPSAGDLSASQLPSGDLPNIVCAGQIVIFGDSVFVHEFTGSGTVFLKSHVTRQDMKKSANNGQAHVEWCVGVPFAWNAKGGPAVQEDTNGDGVLDLYVGVAPACPNASPELSAPCTSRQYGDGNGGSFTEGYLPADPVRRT